MIDELDVMNWTTGGARDALASIFETGFEHAEAGRPYDYADEIIRRLHESGFVLNPVLPDDKWMGRLHDAEAEVERLREALEYIADRGAKWPSSEGGELSNLALDFLHQEPTDE